MWGIWLGLAEMAAWLMAVVLKGMTIEEYIRPALIGKNPFDVEHLTVGGAGGPRAWAGVDAALWDIIGKACNQPVYNLWGGRCHERLRAYANGWYTVERTPEEFAKAARRVVEIALDGEAEKVRREKAAEAAARTSGFAAARRSPPRSWCRWSALRFGRPEGTRRRLSVTRQAVQAASLSPRRTSLTKSVALLNRLRASVSAMRPAMP